MAILLVKDVVKYFDSRRVLDSVSWRIENPGIYSLLGPNGAGKTTLLSIITGIIEPDGGRVLIKDSKPSNPSTRMIIGYCPQEPGLIGNLSGYDNALFYGRLYGLRSRDIIDRVSKMGEKLGLSRNDLRMKVGKYSGGMKKKLALIISLLHDPEILILDEPTTGMDPGVRREVWQLLLDLKKMSKTIILATHYMEEADQLSDRVAIIDRGKIIVEDKPSVLKEKYGPKTVLQLRFENTINNEVIGVVKKYSDKYYVNERIVKIHIGEPEKYVPELIGELYSHGYRVVEFKLVKPTLEDVFLKLTGRRLE